MGDIKQPWLLWAKGGLFLLLGIVASALLLVESPTFTTLLLHGIAIWAFCRAYYFAFYVIEKYVDSRYKFAGLTDFALYALGRKPGVPAAREEEGR